MGEGSSSPTSPAVREGLSLSLLSIGGRGVSFSFSSHNFVANSVFQIATLNSPVSDTENRDTTGAANKLVQLVGGRVPAATPNIYLLVYDAYVGNEAMLAYGIDNRGQEEYLRSLGFII